MKLTERLKSWLRDNCGVAEDAGDDAYKAAAAQAVLDGSLTPDLQKSLTVDADAEKASKLDEKLDQILNTAVKTAEVAANNAKAIAEMQAGVKQPATEEAPKLKGSVPSMPAIEEKMTEPEGDVETPEIRVKCPSERYDTTKTAMRYPEQRKMGAKHAKAGRQVVFNGTPVMEHSQLERAVVGAWFKFTMESQLGKNCPRKLRMTEHDKGIVDFAFEKLPFVGAIGGTGIDDGAKFVSNRVLSAGESKAVLDDATSGGLEISPYVFDEAIIMTPLLYGELFPKVNIKNIDRGSSVKGGAMGNPTVSWAGADGTAIPLFNTASFISAFDTTIHVVNGAIELGLDFLSDSPVDVANEVTRAYGNVMLSEFDRVIADGSGTGEPTGVMQAAGTTDIASANGATGPATVGDYEALLFSVPKEYKAPYSASDFCFCGNETTYSRARGIAVGTTDARRVFGMNQESYELFGHPYAINGTLTNAEAFAGVLPRYRMYMRRGVTMRSTTEGKNLVRDNAMLIAARARLGGQPEDGAAFGVVDDFGPA